MAGDSAMVKDTHSPKVDAINSQKEQLTMPVLCDFKKADPMTINVIGKNYDSTQTLSLHELILFMELKIDQMLKAFAPLGIHVALNVAKNKSLRNQTIEMEVLCDDDHQFRLIQPHIKKIALSYNKTILVEENGEFKPIYNRFKYAIYRSCSNTEVVALAA